MIAFSPQTVFYLGFWNVLFLFLESQTWFFQVIGTKVNRPLMWWFMLIWLGAGMYLIFAIAVGTIGLKFFYYPYFCLLSLPEASLSTCSQTEFVSGSSLPVICCYRGTLVVECGGWWVFSNLRLKCQSSSVCVSGLWQTFFSFALCYPPGAADCISISLKP